MSVGKTSSSSFFTFSSVAFLTIAVVLISIFAMWFGGKSSTMPLGSVTHEARCFVPVPREEREAFIQALWAKLRSEEGARREGVSIKTGHMPTHFSSRTDSFINLSMDDVGIKFRHGSDLELKARTNRPSHDPDRPNLPEVWNKAELPFREEGGGGDIETANRSSFFRSLHSSVSKLSAFEQKATVLERLTELSNIADRRVAEDVFDLEKSVSKMSAKINDPDRPSDTFKVSFEVSFVSCPRLGSHFVTFNIEKAAIKRPSLVLSALQHLVDLSLSVTSNTTINDVIWGGYPHFVSQIASNPSSSSSSSS